MPPLRVAHIPGAHPYAGHLASATTDDRPVVTSLPDVIPEDRPRGQWWPPVMFDPDWITDNAAEFDVMHLHFGFESFSLDHLRATLRSLARAGRPLVFTVHDLANPQLVDQTPHHLALDVLVPGATALITLTRGAAREITERWQREVAVIPHPHVLELDSVAVEGVPDPAGRRTSVVGMHLKDLRPNVDAVRATRTLVGAVEEMRSRGTDVVAEIHLADRVRDEDSREAVRELCAQSAAVTLVEHPRFSDDDLAHSLAATDACVLPYGFGTHSGWLELCFDLALPVVAPALGYYSDQQGQAGAVVSFEPGSISSLATALDGLLVGRGSAPARATIRAERRVGRRQQRELIAGRHEVLYREAIARAATATATATTLESSPAGSR